MSTTARAGVVEQDRTLTDLLESYRHVQADETIPADRRRRAAERMKPVWAKLARLQDPNGFINHISEHIQREFQRRHHHGEDPNLTRRPKPLCRCSRPRHVCEVKQGEVPSKIRTQRLEYIQKPDSRTLAREYVQEHSGDVVVREAMEAFRNLRAEIYAELSEILAMMLGQDLSHTGDSEDGEGSEDSGGGADAPTDADSGTNGPDGPQDAEQPEPADAPTASADGGGDDIPDLSMVADPGQGLETPPEDGEDDG